MLTNNMKIFNFMYNGSLLIVALLAFKFSYLLVNVRDKTGGCNI